MGKVEKELAKNCSAKAANENTVRKKKDEVGSSHQWKGSLRKWCQFEILGRALQQILHCQHPLTVMPRKHQHLLCEVGAVAKA